MRALAFHHLCEHKTLYIGEGELIVGERGPAPKAVPTYPELTCHTRRGPRILDRGRRPATGSPESCIDDLRATRSSPSGRGARMRERIFEALPPEWHDAYEAGSLHRVHGAAGARATPCWTTRSTARVCSTSRRRSPRRSRRWTSPTIPRPRQARGSAGHGHLPATR